MLTRKTSECGYCLQYGKGITKMMDVCYAHGWSDENTILVVKNPGDLDSWWSIYTKKKKTEEK